MPVPPEKVESALFALRQYAGLTEMRPWEVVGLNINPWQIVRVLEAQSVLLIDIHEKLSK